MRNVGTMHASNITVHPIHKLIAKSVHIDVHCSCIIATVRLAIAFLFHYGIKDEAIAISCPFVT